MTDLRQIIESPLNQGKDETISYQLTTTPYGGTPSSVSVTIYDVTEGAYTLVTGAPLTAIMPVNSPSILGDVITLSPLQALTVGKAYRLEVKFTSGGDIWEPYFVVIGEN